MKIKLLDMSVVTEKTLKLLKADTQLVNMFKNNIGELPVEELKYINKKDYKYNKWLVDNYLNVKYSTFETTIRADKKDGTSWCAWEFDDRGNVIYHRTSKGYWKDYVYNMANKLIFTNSSTGRYKLYHYDENDNMVYSKDSNDAIYLCTYDNNNNIITTQQSNGYVDEIKSNGEYFSLILKSNIIKSIEYTYDSNNNLLSFKDSAGYFEDRVYDSNNNLLVLTTIHDRITYEYVKTDKLFTGIENDVKVLCIPINS